MQSLIFLPLNIGTSFDKE